MGSEMCIRDRVIVVQEGFPLFMVTKMDGVKYMACMGHDTMKEVRDRFARLIGCEGKNLILRKHEETEILTEDVDNMTMDDLEMENGCAFDAQRTGLCVFDVVFDFVVCIQVSSALKFCRTLSFPTFRLSGFYFKGSLTLC